MGARGQLVLHQHIVELFLVADCLALKPLPVEVLDVLEVLYQHFGRVQLVRLVELLLDEIVGAVHEVGLRAVVAESLWRLVAGGRNNAGHIRVLLLLLLLLDEVLHEVLFRVDLVVDDLVANAALARTVRTVIELAHVLPLPLEENLNPLFYVGVHAFLR